MAKPKKNKWKVRDFILWYTQFYNTCAIHERDLVKAVNEEYDLSYQLNRFQDLYIDKMPQFRKYKGDDGYWVYQRTDVNPEPDWTMDRLKEFEESYKEEKERKWDEEFLYLIEFASKNNDKEFENHILMEKVLELKEKEGKD